MMAPELTIGLCGRFVPFCSSIELNASPLGSTSTCCQTLSCPNASSAMPNVNGLEIDWMVNGWSQSPASNTWPPAVTTQMPK